MSNRNMPRCVLATQSMKEPALPHCLMLGGTLRIRTIAILGLIVGLCSEGFAQESAQSSFDWRKQPTPGDITAAMSGNRRDNIFIVEPGRMKLTPATTLSQAILKEDSLTLKFTIRDPNQTILFEDMQGTSGSYKPSKWKARSIHISDPAHTERFIRKGTLTLSIDKPESSRRPESQSASQRPSPAPSVPEPGYKPRSEPFARLAKAVSHTYKLSGRSTHRPYNVQWREAAEAGAAYPSAKIQEIAQAMLEGAQEVREINVAAVRADLLREADDLERRIASGEFSRREGYRENGVVAFRTVDESGSAQSRAQQLRAIAAKNDADLKKWQAGELQTTGWADLFSNRTVSRNPDLQFQHLVHEAQRVLWSEAAKHAGPDSKSSLVNFTRPSSSLVQIRNASGKRLSDVTLNVGIGFTRSDKFKSYGAPILLFVPVWKPNELLELEFLLKDPQVLHFHANAFANEASSKEHTISLIDPSNPPNNRPAKIVLREQRGFTSIGRPHFAGTAWAEVDGKRFDWKDTQNPLELTVEPGVHTVVVHARERSRKAQVVYERKHLLDGEDGKQIEVALHEATAHYANQQRDKATRALQFAQNAIAQKNEVLAKLYLKQAVDDAPDSPAGKTAKRLLERLKN